MSFKSLSNPNISTFDFKCLLFMRFNIYLVVFLLLSNLSQAQKAEDNEDPYETKNYFMVGATYLSDNVYLGRKDSNVVSYISPYLGYHFKNGLYAKAIASWVPGRKHLDEFTIEAGYEHSFGDHINAGVAVDKYFYNKNASSVRSSSSGGLSLYGQYSNDWVEPQLNIDLNANKKSIDYVTGLGLDHNFSLLDNTLNITPTVVMNLGTQNYYDEYFNSKLGKADKTFKTRKVVSDANKFKPLDYEFSVKIAYRVAKWLFTLTPTYALPVNPATVVLPKRTVQEKLTNTFYLELDICHR